MFVLLIESFFKFLQPYHQNEEALHPLFLFANCDKLACSRGHVGLLKYKTCTILSSGYLGSRNDEERSEMRYVMRIAKFSESSNLRTQTALPGIPGSTLHSVSTKTFLYRMLVRRVFRGRIMKVSREWLFLNTSEGWTRVNSLTIFVAYLKAATNWIFSPCVDS